MSRKALHVAEALFSLATTVVRQRQRDLSLTALSTLSTIERTGPQRLTDLALCEGVTQPSMSALVNQLEKLGLVQRLPDSSDGRVVLVGATADGHAYLTAVRGEGAAVFQRMIDKLAPEAKKLLADALPALAEMAARSEQDVPAPWASLTA